MEKKILTDVNPRHSFLSQERRDERRGKMIDQNSMETRGYDGRRPSRGRGWLILGVVILVLVVIFAVLTLTAKAYISVTPREELVELDTNLKAYLNPETPLLLGFSVLNATGSETLSVPASGKKYVERKAFGRVTVYNEYSAEPVKIIPNTRFQSETGKIFRVYTSVFIPGYKTVSGKTVPGSIEITVTADQPGVDYNIDPSNFSLPGLAGSPMAKDVYARSQTSMTGGYKGDANVVRDEDLEKAKIDLESKLTSALVEKVKGMTKGEQVIFDGAYSIDFNFNEYGESQTDGESSGDQPVNMQGVISALVLNKQELSSVLAKRELLGVSDENVQIENWPDINVELTNYDNISTTRDVSMRITGTAKFIWQYDEVSLALDLAGTSKKEYAKVFLNYPSIDRAEVDIKPSWKQTFPGNPDRIFIERTKNADLLPES